MPVRFGLKALVFIAARPDTSILPTRRQYQGYPHWRTPVHVELSNILRLTIIALTFTPLSVSLADRCTASLDNTTGIS